MLSILPDQVVIAYKHQVLQYREKIRLCTAVLHHVLHNTENIPRISAKSQGLKCKQISHATEMKMKLNNYMFFFVFSFNLFIILICNKTVL